MSRRTNWESFNKQAKTLKQSVKSTEQAGEFFKEFPPVGYMRDNISKNTLALKDCKSSSLRRYVKLLNKFYYLPISEKEKEMILNKRLEVEKELMTRPDAEVEPKKPAPKKKK